MKADPNQIIVTRTFCHVCGVPIVQVYHEDFAVIRVEAGSAEEAAGYLVNRLGAAIGDAVDPSLREAVRSALADARAFLDGERYANPGARFGQQEMSGCRPMGGANDDKSGCCEREALADACGGFPGAAGGGRTVRRAGRPRPERLEPQPCQGSWRPAGLSRDPDRSALAQGSPHLDLLNLTAGSNQRQCGAPTPGKGLHGSLRPARWFRCVAIGRLSGGSERVRTPTEESADGRDRLACDAPPPGRHGRSEMSCLSPDS